MQNLDDVLADAWRRLSRGVADRRSAFRSPALATVGPDGLPQVRTVVLRAFDPSRRVVTVHSDCRAGKIMALAAQPAVALHVWDAGAQIQLRLNGMAAVFTGPAARGAWDRLHAGSRAAYTVAGQPGTRVADPDGLERVSEVEGFARFAVIEITLSAVEWLHLAKDGHKRARFAWCEAEQTAEWLVP